MNSNMIEQEQTETETAPTISTTTQLRADKIVSAWSGWVNDYTPTEASIAVSYDGNLVASQGEGRSATTPAPIASLTKAITGVCVAKLVDSGLLEFDSTVQSIVPELATDVTLASLLTHTSGFSSDITQDPSIYPGVNQEYLLWVSQQELSASGAGAINSTYAYNNSNYAMLGAAISAVTDKTYETACNELVLEPAGITNASLNPDWRIMSSWGGWSLSAVDHQKFITSYFDSDGYLNQSPLDFANVSRGGGAYYGLGFAFRERQDGGYNFWHNGSWQTNYDGVQYRFATYFASWNNGWSVTVNHNISTFQYDASELDSLLANAAYGN